MEHTTYFYHYESMPSMGDYEELENRMTLEERYKMSRVVQSTAGNIIHSSYENKLLAEKMVKMGYLFQFMKPMDFRNYPPTEPPK